MDVAKAVGVLATNGGKITDYEGGELVRRPAAPIIGVPTTAGTASDVTIFCVITDRASQVQVFLPFGQPGDASSHYGPQN